MKGNYTKSHKNLILWLLLLFVSAVLLITTIRYAKEPYTKSKSSLPDIEFNGDDGYQSNQQNGDMLIKATTGLVFQSNSLVQNVDIPNHQSNLYAMRISLYLGSGELLYESDYIYPSDTLSSITLCRNLKSGIYKNVVMVYRFYSVDTHMIISQCELPLEIQCK